MQVLRNAKSEYKKSQYLDKDPIKALSILKRKTTLGKNVVHNIGYDPFYVHFWSSHQNRLYNKVNRKCAVLIIDATGKVAPKLKYADGRNAKYLFIRRFYSVMLDLFL